MVEAVSDVRLKRDGLMKDSGMDWEMFDEILEMRAAKKKQSYGVRHGMMKCNCIFSRSPTYT